MIETLKKELLPGMMIFDLRSTLDEISKYSKMDVSIKGRNVTTNGVLSLVLICGRPTQDMAAGTAWDNCGICEHLSPTHNLSQALTAGLPAKLNSAQCPR